MSTPEVRLSPINHAVAFRFSGDVRWTVHYGTGFERYVVDEDVSEWTPLLPVSNEDGA